MSKTHSLMYSVGQTIGDLTITGMHRDGKNKRYIAECVCVCGNTKDVATRYLQRGTSSCGCKVNRDYSSKPKGEAVFNRLVQSYKTNAKSKGLEFSLTNEQCRVLFDGVCYFCGKPPSKVLTSRNGKDSITYSSIDRCDSSLGYTADNVSSCCTECNYLKGNKSNEEFLNHIQRIYEYLSNAPQS